MNTFKYLLLSISIIATLSFTLIYALYANRGHNLESANDALASINGLNISIEYTEPNFVSTKEIKKMLAPVVRLSMASMSKNANGELSFGISNATGVSVRYNNNDKTSYVLTNNHFCADAAGDPSYILVAEYGDQFRAGLPMSDAISGRIVKTSPSSDLCIIAFNAYIRPVRIAHINSSLNQFDKLYIVGGPAGIFPIMLNTYFSSYIDRKSISLPGFDPTGNPFLVISEHIVPGHSGSPIFNENMEMVGLVFAGSAEYGGFAIQHKDIIAFMLSLGL